MYCIDENEQIKQEYISFITNNEFICIAAKAALAKEQLHVFIAGNMACPNDDAAILNFLYNFITGYRKSAEMYHSAVVIFKSPCTLNEEMFDMLLWQRLQQLSIKDSENYMYDCRVDKNIASPHFSFSLKEEALFVIGLHAANSRPARRFNYPALVFNPHEQFEHLRKAGKYEKMKNAVRKRDMAFSGSINPVLTDYGNASEVYQYSGKKYNKMWQCPLKIKHT